MIHRRALVPGMPVAVGNKEFPSRKAAITHFKLMLSRYEPDDTVADEDAEELNALLQLHPDAVEKIGVGVDHFEVMSADYGTHCFAAVQRNGVRTRFSYFACINR
jgi:hypothetical protein